ncbi:Nucleoporin [Podosphaera aphanis]|nr:Nucleoporin [Podosphaera aphanis]
MSFKVPEYSPTPSTPDTKANGGKNNYSFGPYPSTTPAGLPSYSTSSETAQHFMGDSLIRFDDSPTKQPIFSQQGPTRSGILTGTNDMASMFNTGLHPLSPPPKIDQEDNVDVDMESSSDSQRSEEIDDDVVEEEEEEEEGEREEGGREEEEAEYENEQEMVDYNPQLERSDDEDLEHDDCDRLSATPQSSKDDLLELPDSNWLQRSHTGVTSKYEKIARDMYSRIDVQSIEESDDIILATEGILANLIDEDSPDTAKKPVLDDLLSTTSSKLVKIWENYDKQTAVYSSEEYTTSVGPPAHALSFTKANFLASLALKIYHPPKSSSAFTAREMPLPQRLLEWMEEHHNPYPNQYKVIQSHKPSPASHSLFWDTVFNCLIRGKVTDVANMIRDAGWSHVKNDPDNLRESQSQTSYSDVTMKNIEKVISATIQTLLNCPASRGDWNSLNNDWKLFRLRTSQALEDLRDFTEGRSQAEEGRDSSIADSGSYSRAATKAKSLIPWHLYQNIVTIYNILMGDKSSILAIAQDWCEATISLVAWWNEENKDRNVSLSSLRQLPRLPNKAASPATFDKKLRISFEIATSDATDNNINSANEVEVALASLFEKDIESVIGFLRGWSGPISCAVAEIASLAGWLPKPEERSLIRMGSLDQDDFELLGIISSPSKNDGVKDRTLITYAKNVAKRGELRSTARPQDPIAGWQVAIAIFGRLDSVERSSEIIWEFLQELSLQDSKTVKKLLEVLNRIGLTRHAESAAQSYADELAEQSSKYGEALYYYALAHQESKVKEVLAMLMSHSLVQSRAYPSAADLDPYLRDLIASPKKALSDMASQDVEAARLLHKSLSGYATLRTFYDLRDRDLARKSDAALPLITVISSSSDNIRGGLYDSESSAVVNTEFLLALLGEASVLINQADFSLTAPQIDVLLRAIEDLQTVPTHVYAACVDFLNTVLAFDHPHKGPMSVDNLRKSTTSHNGASHFSKSLTNARAGSRAEGAEKRGWDWREGMVPGITGEDLLKKLRLGLAKDLARTWLSEVDNQA